MKNEIVALLLAGFIVINIITFLLFARSHRRVQFRQAALSPALLSGFAVMGGGVAAYIAVNQFRTIADSLLDRRVIALVAFLQVALLCTLVGRTLLLA